ncbi:MAG: biotin/lipoate A/B protein ligase family protein [Candidatus Aenigmarchaeota archaeon]|nr:biotin/lipoate A/B protein ligase family protein [Candidatus Aenigmarchaeota archaeon]MDI6722228.1 biotin/lipoate A/B protein ligase family protein [Candidatus Aenigmarchaeota archaeon]
MKWRIIRTEANNAFMNMAIDETVSEGVAKGGQPTIRFYKWYPSAVSIGYFQSLDEEVDAEACRLVGVDIVRRRTGGGAVYHDYNGEITYSIIGKEDVFPKGITESYREICGYIINGLAILGIHAEFKPINDIIVNGKKISGNAQTRRNGVLLQHGTILYDLDVRKMFSLLKVGKEKISDKFIQSVEERVTRVLNHSSCSLEELEKSLITGFTKNREFELGALTAEEIGMAKRLAAERYASREWNWMR